MPIASVAKIMTAYLTLRRHLLRGGQDGFVLTVTAADAEEEQQRAARGESILPVRIGERLKLAAVAMHRSAFAQIVNESTAVLPIVGSVSNYNQLVGHDGYVGIKTGSDGAAGGCLVFAKRVLIGGRRLMVLGDVLGQRDGSLIPAALNAGRRLGDSVAAALRSGLLVPPGTAAFVGRQLARLL